MLDKVKNALRVKTAAFDDEIQDLIDACKADLRLVGVNVPEDTPAEGKEAAAGDSLITRAIVLYAKANFGYSEDSEKYRAAYDYLKCSLSLAGDYHALG
jgi:predicted nucleic acid-binding protein